MKVNKSRRDLLKSGLAGGALLAVPRVLWAAPAVTLTIVSGSPTKHVISSGGVDPWMNKLKDLVGDAVEYKYYPGGQLVPLKGLLDAVQNGLADAAPIPVGYSSDKMPLNGVTTLPGLGATAKDVITAYTKSLKSELFMREYKNLQLVPLWNMAFPPYQYVATNGPVKTADGFKGKVIRASGGTTDLAIRALGGAPVNIGAGDIYVAMQRGTVNATFSSYLTIEGYGIVELCDAASHNGSFGNFSNVFCISQSKWDGLPHEIQDAMMKASAWEEEHVAQVMADDHKELAKKFQDAGLEVYDFPENELQKINKELEAVQQEWVKRLTGRGLPADKVLNTYQSALTKA